MKCRICCVVWLRFRDGQVQRGCPHCWRVIGKHDELDEGVARQQVQRSLEGHAQACKIAVRLTSRAAGTTVESAPRATAQKRAERARYARR